MVNIGTLEKRYGLVISFSLIFLRDDYGFSDFFLILWSNLDCPIHLHRSRRRLLHFGFLWKLSVIWFYVLLLEGEVKVLSPSVTVRVFWGL